MTCALDACRICTGCAHSSHDKCRRYVTCPNDDTTHPCACCGPEAQPEVRMEPS